MLFTTDRNQFASGRARFFDEDTNATEGTAEIFVKIEPENLGASVLAQVDTGSAWSILNAEVAEALSLLNGQGQPVKLGTRRGDIDGQLERTTLTILADEGESLLVEATVFVSKEWRWGNFLGYEGLLSRVRFGVDPQQNFFYFGRIV